MTAKIAFQGAPGAFSHQAAKGFAKQLDTDADFMPCQTFGEVFSRVADGTANYGAVPLENSSIGSIVANYDLLWNNNSRIISEFFLPVHHHLIGFPDADVSQIELVFSHPAALDQCRGLFSRNPKMAARVHWDTSGSVVHVKESGNRAWAAIAGELAAQEYGMKILMRDIEDFSHNATRFGLITAAQNVSPNGLAAPYKMSCAVELEHKPGTLASLLNALSAAGANLTKIESRPIGESPWHYRFFLDIEVPSPEIERKIIDQLQAVSQNHKVLGRYPKQ